MFLVSWLTPRRWRMNSINKLPNELLSEIMIAHSNLLASAQGDSATEDAFLHRYQSPNTFLLVCRRWNAVAFATPALWASIRLFINPAYIDRTACAVEQASLRIARSKNVPLEIRIFNSCSSTVLSFLKPLLPASMRWRTLVISGTSSGQFVHALPRHLPKLRMLRLTSLTLQEDPNDGMEAPQLQALYLLGCSIFWNLSNSPLSNLTKLALLDSKLKNLEVLYTQLSNCSRLEQIQLVRLDFSQPANEFDIKRAINHTLQLPVLSTLKLDGWVLSLLLLSTIEATSLDTLSLGAFNVNSDIPDFTYDFSRLKNNFPNLKTLVLYPISDPFVPILATILLQLPQTMGLWLSSPLLDMDNIRGIGRVMDLIFKDDIFLAFTSQLKVIVAGNVPIGFFCDGLMKCSKNFRPHLVIFPWDALIRYYRISMAADDSEVEGVTRFLRQSFKLQKISGGCLIDNTTFD